MLRTLFLSACAAWLAPLASSAEVPLTLPAAVAEALGSGVDAALLAERLEVAASLEAEARSALWPRLGLRGSYAQTNGAMPGFGMILGQRTFDNLVDFNRPGRLDNATAAVDFSYRVYAGGADVARVRAASARKEADVRQVEADRAELSLAVVRAYLDRRQALRLREAMDASQAALSASLQVAVAAEAEGRLLKAERLNLAVQLAQVEQQRLVADSLVRLSARRLCILLGRPAAEEVALAPLPTEAANVEPAAGSDMVRPEVLAMRQRVAAAEAAVAMADSGRLPTVDFQATYQHDQGWLRSGSGTSWSAGLVGRYNLFDAQETSSRVRAARAELRAAELSLRKLEAEMAFDLAKARLTATQADARVPVARQAVGLAEESARLTHERFDAGKALSAELIAVEARLAESRLLLLSAESEQVVARLSLRRALALPLFP